MVVAEVSRRLLQLLEQLLSILSVDLCWTTWPRSVVRSLLDRFEEEPIEPIPDRFLDDAVAFSQRIQLIARLRPIAARTRSRGFPSAVCSFSSWSSSSVISSSRSITDSITTVGKSLP